jgi:aldose 1-epimerase
MKITQSIFGKTANEEQVDLFTLTNDKQLTVKITNYGGIITSIEMPDKNGLIKNIALGFETLDGYTSDEYLGSYPYFGCICGRVCNRIAEGKFTLEGKNYSLAVNNGPNHLHGGLLGFDRKVFSAKIIEKEEHIGVKLSYQSQDMEEGYPGNLIVTCTYTLNNNNELGMEYGAETDQTTIINLTNHTYFNLTGGSEDILNHELEIPSKFFVDSIGNIPTGQILSVTNTPFDFLTKKKLGKDIAPLFDGYDLSLVLGNNEGNLVFAGCLSEVTSGLKVDVFTTQPAVHLYTGYWNPELTIGGQKKFGRFSGVALETQHFPDSINQPHFPPVVLKPGQTFSEKTVYKFGYSA